MAKRHNFPGFNGFQLCDAATAAARRSLKPLQMVALATLLTSGCATVKSYSVSSSTKEGEAKGKVEGIPYYLPRPYVAVKKPFPVSGFDVLTSGTVGKDGAIAIAVESLPEPLKALALGGSLGLFSSDTKSLVARQEIVFLQSADGATSDPKSGGDASKGEKGEGEQGEKGEAEPEEDASTKVETTGTTSPLVPISDIFDIVYLPDFSQKYVLRLRPRLGKLEANIALQGGMLSGLTVNLDNTAVASMVSEGIATALGAAKEIAVGKLVPASTDEAAEELQSLENETVTVRVRFAAEALPGVYPIMKPGEEVPPCKTPCTPAQAGVANATLVLPVGPYTRVAYRVRHTLVVELPGVAVASKGVDKLNSQPASSPRDAKVAEKAEIFEWITQAGVSKYFASSAAKLEVRVADQRFVCLVSSLPDNSVEPARLSAGLARAKATRTEHLEKETSLTSLKGNGLQIHVVPKGGVDKCPK